MLCVGAGAPGHGWQIDQKRELRRSEGFEQIWKKENYHQVAERLAYRLAGMTAITVRQKKQNNAGICLNELRRKKNLETCVVGKPLSEAKYPFHLQSVAVHLAGLYSAESFVPSVPRRDCAAPHRSQRHPHCRMTECRRHYSLDVAQAMRGDWTVHMRSGTDQVASGHTSSRYRPGLDPDHRTAQRLVIVAAVELVAVAGNTNSHSVYSMEPSFQHKPVVDSTGSQGSTCHTLIVDHHALRHEHWT